MTDKPIIVQQCDRERACRIMSDRWHSKNIQQVLSGGGDHWIPVMECARHRMEAEARVVAWLREEAGKDTTDLHRLHQRKQLTPSTTSQWETMIILKGGIADAIERGEHISLKIPLAP